MTDGQLAYFRNRFDTVSARVSRRLFKISGISTAADARSFVGFSLLDIARCTGLSKSHVANLCNEKAPRNLSPDGLARWRDLLRQVVVEILGAGYSIEFSDGLRGRIVTTCQRVKADGTTCGRAAYPQYHGQPARCRWCKAKGK